MITLDTICNIWIIVCEIIGFLIFRDQQMITLKNWYQQQPEVVYFVQTDYQGDEFMKKFVRSKMPKEQWDKIIAKYSDREIYRVETENINGELHSWVYFKEGE